VDTSSREYLKAHHYLRKAENNRAAELANKRPKLFTGSVNNFNPPSNGE
jgi:hypothetical protein